MEKSILIFLLGITVASSIYIEGGSGGGFGGGGGYGGRDSSGSWSSEEHGHGHGHGHHGGRPPRPRPPRPPPQRDPVCERGWMTFDRPQGTWCVKVFNGGGLAQDAGRVVSNANGGGLAEIWVGATRRAGCVNRQDCLPNDSFQWTDGVTTGTEGFYFPGVEPNAYGGQNCLEVHVSVADGVAARFGYSHGDLDDDQCFKTDIRLYACGKRPS